MPAADVAAQPPAQPLKPPKLSQLRKWQRWDVKRKQLAQQAKDLGTLQEQLEREFEPYVRAQIAARPPGDESPQALFISGFTLAIDVQKNSVAWSKEFLRECGEAKTAAARAAAGTKEVLVIKAPA